MEDNELEVENEGLLDLGLKKYSLNNTFINEISLISEKYLNRIDKSKIPCNSFWRKK